MRRIIKAPTTVGTLFVGVLLASRAVGAGSPRFTVTTAGVLDAKTGLTWEQTAPATKYPWAAVKDYCAGKPSGWRLPNIRELQSIVDETRSLKVDPLFVLP